MFVRSLVLVSALALGAPAILHAQGQWGAYGSQQAYNEGYQRGLRAGEDDVRRGDSFNYNDESDFRRGDVGYRREYGSVDVYRNQFRRGFETGYRAGYDRFDNDRYGNGRYGSDRRNGPPPWSNGRANGRAGRYGDPYGNVGYNYAVQNGYADGFDRGLDDGRARRRNDPFAESRYRSGDHGYKSQYGTKETYRLNYREAFRDGYERGYSEGRRNSTSSNRPWWPF